MFGSYIMFHYVRGTPFEFNGGAFDNLNMWEQIDNGAQYTPAKKFLLSVPIVLFLLSTHYTHYDLVYFIINFLAVLAVVIPKLPMVGALAFDDTHTHALIRPPANSCHRATGCVSASSRALRTNSTRARTLARNDAAVKPPCGLVMCLPKGLRGAGGHR
jgi:hypothetical protein